MEYPIDATEAAAEGRPVPLIHLVVGDHGISWAHVDNEELAHRRARAVEAVVVSLPVTADYRARGEVGG